MRKILFDEVDAFIADRWTEVSDLSAQQSQLEFKVQETVTDALAALMEWGKKQDMHVGGNPKKGDLWAYEKPAWFNPTRKEGLVAIVFEGLTADNLLGRKARPYSGVWCKGLNPSRGRTQHMKFFGEALLRLVTVDEIKQWDSGASTLAYPLCRYLPREEGHDTRALVLTGGLAKLITDEFEFLAGFRDQVGSALAESTARK